MKKKLLLSVLAAGLVLPTASALATNSIDDPSKIWGVQDEKAKKEAEKVAADKAEKEAIEKLVKDAVATPKAPGVGKDIKVTTPNGNVDYTKAVDKTLAANEDAKKPEMDKKDAAANPVAPTTNKAANKAGMKKLPKTSAVK